MLYLYITFSKEPQSAIQWPYPILIQFPIHLHSAAMLQCLVYCNAKSARMFISIYTVFHKQNTYNNQYKVKKPSAIIYITGCYLRNAMAELGVFWHSWGKSKQYKIHTLVHLTEVTCCGKEMGYGYHCIIANWKGSHLNPLVISCEDANYLSYKPCQKTFCEDRALFVLPIVHCTVDHSFLKARLSSSIFVRPSLQKQSFNTNIVHCALQMEVVCKSPWAAWSMGLLTCASLTCSFI